MITKLKVTGFRSLENFCITFKEGLNVLLGPNGVGKSNICNVIGLISAFADNNLDEYIYSLGGIKTVFTILNSDNSNSDSKSINIYCEGLVKDVDLTDIDNSQSKNNDIVNLKYKYNFSLVLLEKELKITDEKLTLYKENENSRFVKIMNSFLTKENKVFLRIKDKNSIGPLSQVLEKKNLEEPLIISNYENSENKLKSILDPLNIIFFCYIVKNDLRDSKVWNIDPHIAKKSSDLTEPYIMLSNGRRLPNRLYHLYKTNNEAIVILEEILSKLIPKFKKIKPEVSTEELVRTFSLIDENGTSYPSKSLSDGTIKLIALLVGVFSQGLDTSIIEEPENYLHPRASQVLIEYLRDYFSDGICIITTHSETILNSIYPEEIIVVTMENGQTKCSRISNSNKLIQSIKKSGFGCGYHYVSGSLGGIPND